MAKESDESQYVPDENSRRVARTMAGYRVPEADIAAVLSISVEMLRAHYAADMERGRSQVNANLAQRLYDLAVGREREVRQVEKTRIDANGKEKRYMGQEVVREAIRPDSGIALYLARMWLGWGSELQGTGGANGLPPPDKLDWSALTDAELAAVQRAFAKMESARSAQPRESAGPVSGSGAAGGGSTRH